MSCSQAGNFVREEILSAFIRLVAHTPELQHYTTSKLFLALKEDISQESLTIAATWVLGEYSEVIIEGGVVDDDTPARISDKELIDLILSTLDSPYANSLTQQYTLSSITKISSRPSTSRTEQDRIQEVLTKYVTSPELELQQRAVEFAGLFNLGSVREGVLERMPPPELKATVMDVGSSDYFLDPCSFTNTNVSVSEKKPVGSTKAVGDLLVDEASPTQGFANDPTTSAQTNQDLLAEIFGSNTPTASAPITTSSAAPAQHSTVDDILGLFGSSTPASAGPAPAQTPVTASTPSFFSLPQTQASPPPSKPSQAPPASRLTAYTVYEQNELKVTLTPQTSLAKPGIIMIQARFQVTGGSPAAGINFQAAVPKVGPNFYDNFLKSHRL